MATMIDALSNRQSIPAKLLHEPAPTDEELGQILRCGLSAPDHGKLHPWQFITLRGEARDALGDVFVEAAKRRDNSVSDNKLNALREKPLRSPLIVVIVATITDDHPKVPAIEQVLSAGAATQQILLAATALGFGSIWLTGENAYDDHVKESLGITPTDHIIGFVYMGTASMAETKIASETASGTAAVTAASPDRTNPDTSNTKPRQRLRPALENHLRAWPAP